MTFHFDQFEEYERNDNDLKVLLDRLRVYSLLRFRLNNAYKERVNKEIDRVNFSNVAKFYHLTYKLPYPICKAYYYFHLLVSRLKHN